MKKRGILMRFSQNQQGVCSFFRKEVKIRENVDRGYPRPLVGQKNSYVHSHRREVAAQRSLAAELAAVVT